jgi:hypothetical protein
MLARRTRQGALALIALLASFSAPAEGQVADFRARDRGGNGIPSSQFATFIEEGEIIFYPYYEYYRDDDAEYKPSELGYTDNVDYFGRYRAHEGLLFLGYGISGRLHVELEAAVITAKQERADDDTSDFPAVGIEESGLGDVEAQLRYRFREETDGSPEVYGYFETVFPLQEKNTLIGTSAWEFQYGMGLARSFSFGTMIFRGAVAWADGSPEIGEYAVEYVRGLSDFLRLYGAVEGSEDEVEFITEVQVHFTPNIRLKLNNALGVTKKAPDWAPEVGLMFSF